MVFGDWVAVLRDFLKIDLDFFLSSWESEKVKAMNRIIIDVFEDKSVLVAHRAAIFLDSLFQNFIDLEDIIVRFHEERLRDC